MPEWIQVLPPQLLHPI